MNIVEKSVFRPFSFEGGNFETLSPGKVAENNAKAHDGSAIFFEKKGRMDLALKQRRIAAGWRGLKDLSDEDAKQLGDKLFLKGEDAIDALLALAEKRESPLPILMLLANQILDGLLHLAPVSNKAAGALMVCLSESVNNFEFLASRKPGVFRECAKNKTMIPGLISQKKEQAKENQRLLIALQGKKSNGGSWKFEKANLLALRLTAHIINSNKTYGADKSLAQHCRLEIPAWRVEAAKLDLFSALTWKSWLEVAWKVLMEISPKNDPALHPDFYDPKTKVSNVRKTRMEDNFSNSQKSAPKVLRQSPSIRKNDIKETMSNAFELIATGISKRTKQRRKAKKKIIKAPRLA